MREAKFNVFPFIFICIYVCIIREINIVNKVFMHASISLIKAGLYLNSCVFSDPKLIKPVQRWFPEGSQWLLCGEYPIILINPATGSL